MKKSLLVKISVLLIVTVLSYCVFWFFKAGQSEKAFYRFLSEASTFISTEEIKVSGFPTKQKFLVKNAKISLNSGVFRNHKILVGEAELETGIFDSNYQVKIIGPVKLEEADNAGHVLEVKLNSEPKIQLTLAGGSIANFSYNDAGYIVSDETNNNIFASAATDIKITSSADKSGKILINVNGNIDGIESFDIADIFKNLFEKKLVESLKNDEIKIALPTGFRASEAKSSFIQYHQAKLASASAALSADNSQPNPDPANPNPTINPSQNPTPAPNQPDQAPVQNQPAASAASAATVPSSQATAPENSTLVPAPTPPSVPVAKGKLKFDFVIEIVGGTEAAPVSIGQESESAATSSHLLRISEIKFTRGTYEIALNGSLTKNPDDSLPSGGLSIKISDFGAMLADFDYGIEKLLVGAEKYSEIAKPKTDFSETSAKPENKDAVTGGNTSQPESGNQQAVVKSAQNPEIPSDPTSLATNAEQPLISQSYNMNDYYSFFLIRFADLYQPISTELALKNTVTKENIAQFDIRREKNLEFFVNETPIREVLGRLQ